LKPCVGWKTSVSGLGNCVVEGEITLSREWALLYCGGDQYASNAYAGPLECTARFTTDFASTGDVNNVLSHGHGAVAVGFATDEGVSGGGISIPNFYFADGLSEIDTGGVYSRFVVSGRGTYEDGDGPASIS